MRSFVAAAIAVASWACVSSVASAQIRPRFMILFDTSGSMAVDLDGIPTFGDGITGPTRGLDTDCDGLANDSRIFVAKEALRNMVLAFGDIEFGLTSFPRFASSQVACSGDPPGGGTYAITHRIQNNECNLAMGPFVGGIGDPTANNGAALTIGNCGSQWDGIGGNEIPTDLIPAACRPGSGGRPAARLWAAGSPVFCTNYLGGCPGQFNGIYTYPNGDVLVGFSGFGWPTTVDNRVGMLKWIDQRETSFSASTTSGNFCNHSGTGDCELRPQGPTPLAGTLRAARDYMIPIRTADPVGTCRPYTVLLLTDGVETCDASMTAPVTTAAELRAAGIPVYVVGLAIDPGGRTLLNQIATAGGTDAGGAGGDTAFFADDEVTLAAGLADIVADSLLVEVCNDRDDNCNGLIDEGFVKYCNRPAGVTGLSLCADPGETVCNGVDDNCNGRVDEGLLNACGACGAVPTEVCNGLDDDCDGVIDDGGVCDTCRPEAEICDDRDNDCDGRIDETLSRACGVDVGECSAGTQTCTRGAWGMCSDVGPSPEICNGLDDDCDGLPDNLIEACGSDVGACNPGIRRCVAGSFGTCEGAIGPVAETCNTIDDDCDGRVDEMVPGVGVACGTDEGVCTPGATACVAGAIVCSGGTGPTDEVCNGLDDDCDGLVDDGIFVGTPCGSDVGECSPGFNRCVDGMLRCEDAIGPMGEACNGLDDDCDGDVDEGLGIGEACGSDEGVCMPGALQCVDGEETCVGEVPGGPEACDCEDDDCDGAIDEVPPGGSLCPAGSACVECQCALPCVDSEFGPSCPTGRAPREIDGTCFCVREACNAAACATETIARDGETLCAPDSDDVSTCVCRDNECTFACEGVVCAAGTVCDPRDPAGRCVEDSCRGLGCPSGELCDVVSGECEPDPCETLSCGDQACRAGTCEPSCADVECPSGQRCASGVCVADMCADKPCPGQVCDPATGACVDDQCGDVRCPVGALCDPVSGDCELDPCRTLRCPSGELCIDGECARDGEPMRPDAGTTPDRTRVLAAGGGGCSCDAAGASSGVGGSGWLVVLGLGVWMFVRRLGSRARGSRAASRGSRAASRASARRRVALTVAAGALFFGGCDVEPFCFDCQESLDAGPIDAGPIDSGRRDAMLPDVGTPDAGDAGCLAAEECNGRDDDCDGNVDEGIDTATDPRNCGECGNVCSPPGAFPVCTAGVCGVGGCDVGFVDLNDDPADGCEYRCLQRAEDDVVCDLRDDDCDGEVDEDVDTTTDVLNCGACGRACRFSRATPTCNAGTCEIASCNEGFYDLDRVAGNGCEYGCLIADPPTERCNARDDDCDGTVDEGNPDSGAACGETAGECEAGTQQCMGGSLVCVGAVGPRVETCNTRDDDCDARTDETTNLLSDPNNCGGCGVVCSQPNAVTRCSGGTCSRVSCRSGFVDLDGMAGNGCEYACDARGAEVCNGADDDCDGRTDEGLTPPSNFCNANGICAGTTPTCGGAMGWRCTYTSASYQEVESRCDGVDNDCDGMVDEPFPTRGNACSNGRGLCQRNGMLRCTADGTGLECSAPAPGMPGAETCDGRDEDCDGRTDEGLMPNAGGVSTVRFTRPGATVHVMSYEASRPDATMSAAGSSNTAACSRASRIPWTTVTWDQAQAACCALNAGGTCPGAGADGWRLCDGDDWQRACEGPAGTCDWSYASNCTTSQPTVCNGSEVTGADAIAATGAFASCNTPWTGVGNVYDLSGNVKEWTSTQVATGVYAIRGGAYNNLEAGRTCEFDFTVGSRDFAFPNTGFRCCFYDF